MNRFEENLWESVVDRHGEELARAGAPVVTRRRRARPPLVAGATLAVAASAAAATLLVGASASAPPAFAVTRHHDGSVSVKINRKTSMAEVNRRLTAMGIERISKRTMAADAAAMSSIPNCASIPPGWKGEWVQMAGSSSGPGYTIDETVPAGTWVLVMCDSGNPAYAGLGTTGKTRSNSGNTGSGNTGSGGTGNTGSGNTGAG